MKVSEAIRYSDVIKSIVDKAPDVSALVKFKLLGMAKQLQPVVDSFETVRREKIFKYGTSDGNGGASILEPKREDFENDEDYNKALSNYKETVTKMSKELEEVLLSDVEVNIKKFKYTEIIDAGLSADYLVALYGLIEEWLGGIE